jgi:UDP-glucuronate 4-epimerase
MGRPDMAYFKILASLFNKTTFTVFGNGNDVRDFTYISDVVSAVRALDDELGDHALGFCDVVNIGGGNPRSLNEMIEILEVLIGQPLLRVEGEKLNADVNKTIADFTYLYKLIGTTPSIKLEEGLKKFTNWGKSNPYLIGTEK